MKLNTLGIAHKIIKEKVCRGNFCIDATAGRGHDTAFLCGLVGEEGRVLAMDIQQDAVDSTRALLQEKGYDQIAQDELSGTFMKKLNDSPGEWLLVDFFSLSSPRAHRIGDHYFTDFRGLIADALHAEKYSFLDDMPISEVQRRLRIYAQALKQRYGSHIIMIQCKRQDTFLSQESEIKKFSDKVIEKNKKANPLMYEMSQYFVQLTNCYYSAPSSQ